MTQDTASHRRYEWQISLEVDGEELESLFQGDDSSAMLGRVFAMWLHDRGDVSQWANVVAFGELIIAYSDLDADTVAVWLGIEPDRLDPGELEGLSPEEEVSWQMVGPNGESMSVARRVVSEDG
ncbi:hypothetical protein [Halosimplex pelagicum]|uniref:Uncharacterized protein n=1 Tax=Halosimplex pelagicum TaxID=869886 RepID=A0A7D5P962_9EURY|nr:hypothetical protein [Halosimplex pelagicum]QLH83843.1 hypothetical protein HZS54_20380 [Halosimplex pelagicum]